MLIGEAQERQAMLRLSGFILTRDWSTLERIRSRVIDFYGNGFDKATVLKRAVQFNFSIRDCSQLLSLYDQPDRSSLDVKAIASNKLSLMRS